MVLFMILTAGVVFPITTAFLGWVYGFGRFYIIALDADFFGYMKTNHKIEEGKIKHVLEFIGTACIHLPMILLVGLSLGSSLTLAVKGF
jgi:hypothetical protein